MLITLDQIVQRYHPTINGVIHIGAHWGQEYPDYVRHGIKNMMFFEPVPVTFAKLVEHLPKEHPGVALYNLALGNFTGKKVMNLETENKGQSSSFLEPEYHLKMSPEIIFHTKQEMDMDKLDNIEFDRSLYNMINIDVQGYELEVFKGSVKTLETIDIVYAEVNFVHVYKDCVLVDELDEFLKKFGFVRILTNYSPKNWGDALYLKY